MMLKPRLKLKSSLTYLTAWLKTWKKIKNCSSYSPKRRWKYGSAKHLRPLNFSLKLDLKPLNNTTATFLQTKLSFVNISSKDFFTFHHFVNFTGVPSNVMADGINRQRYHTEMLKTTYRETVFLMYFSIYAYPENLF